LSPSLTNGAAIGSTADGRTIALRQVKTVRVCLAPKRSVLNNVGIPGRGSGVTLTLADQRPIIKYIIPKILDIVPGVRYSKCGFHGGCGCMPNGRLKMKQSRAIATAVNEPFLHGRPAASLAALAGEYLCDIQLVTSDGTANAKSLMQLLMIGLYVPAGGNVTIVACGEQSDEAVLALKEFIESGCGSAPQPEGPLN